MNTYEQNDLYDELEIIEDETPSEKQSPLLWLKNNYKDLPMTYILVAINVLVFLIIHATNLLIGDNWFLLNFAKITHYIAVEHEYFRLFTPIFMHESITHLLFNCIAIIFLGRPIEQIFGKYKLLLIFLVAGLFGSLSSFIFSEHMSIGASGGVFGFFGVHMYLYLKNTKTYLKVFGKDIFQLLIINIFIGFAVPNIDFWAHFGGIFGGFLASYTVSLTHKFTINKNFILWSMSTIIIFASLFYYFDTSYVKYDEYISESIDQANIYLKQNDLENLKIVKEGIIKNQPKLPPRPGVDELITEIDYYIELLSK